MAITVSQTRTFDLLAHTNPDFNQLKIWSYTIPNAHFIL